MNKKRNAYIYHLVGVISKRTKCEIQGDKEKKFYWRLETIIENKPEIKSIKVFTNSLENKAIWPAIENKEWFGKKYTFHCRNWKGVYYLINWKELDSFPKELSNSSSINKDHAN